MTYTDLDFSHPFRTLGNAFYADVSPEPVDSPYWVHFNAPLARELGLAFDVKLLPDEVDFFCGNRLFNGQKPLSMLYAGHQFGHYVQQLGDGRAMQLGSTTAADNQTTEWQLKGAGRTPFSRGSDGRAVLRSSIREYLCSVAMAGLGIPTTQALSLVGSDTPVYREERETAALVMRTAPSFVRFGSFEVFFYRGQIDEIKALADFVIAGFYPECIPSPQPYLAFLSAVIERTAALVASWQSVGFCHGVLNTDNMSILGLALDYGPFGFLDTYEPAHVCNHSDHEGRYSFENQPFIGLWNLHCLAQALLPLINDIEAVKTALAAYQPSFDAHFNKRFSAKLGLSASQATDGEFIQETLKMMAHNRLDFTLFFRRLAYFDINLGADIRNDCIDLNAFDDWVAAYAARLAQETTTTKARQAQMNATNPKFILRNHHAQHAIELAQNGDYSGVSELFDCLNQPFAEHIHSQHLAAAPTADAMAVVVSCSS